MCLATSVRMSHLAAENPGEDFDAADPDSTGQIMEFRVVPAVAPDPTTPPQFLELPPITPLPAGNCHTAAGADRDDVQCCGSRWTSRGDARPCGR